MKAHAHLKKREPSRIDFGARTSVALGCVRVLDVPE
jgi:hypothetical protein